MITESILVCKFTAFFLFIIPLPTFLELMLNLICKQRSEEAKYSLAGRMCIRVCVWGRGAHEGWGSCYGDGLVNREIDLNRIGSSDVALYINGLSMDYAINVAKIISIHIEKKN